MTTSAPAIFEEKNPVTIMNRNLAILQILQTFVGHFCALNDEYDIPPITEMSEIEHCKN